MRINSMFCVTGIYLNALIYVSKHKYEFFMFIMIM